MITELVTFKAIVTHFWICMLTLFYASCKDTELKKKKFDLPNL